MLVGLSPRLLSDVQGVCAAVAAGLVALLAVDLEQLGQACGEASSGDVSEMDPFVVKRLGEEIADFHQNTLPTQSTSTQQPMSSTGPPQC